MYLKKYRMKKGMTIRELSEKSEVPIRTIEDIERRGSCTVITASKLAATLNISLDELINDKIFEQRG